MTTIPQKTSLRAHPTPTDRAEAEMVPVARLAGAVEEYVPLFQEVKRLFVTEEFDRLLPLMRIVSPALKSSPLAQTEPIARDWLANGGKRFRPFVTLAAYVARRANEARSPAEVQALSKMELPDAVKKAAIAIEAFHKASLVHDDIQDGDLYRYGLETLHRRYGTGQAINIGDYLIGMGYRLLADCRVENDATAVADIVNRMSLAHIRLCEGQGAEMTWTDAPSLELTSADALQIYALKTSPAFEAALYSGLRLAGDMEQYEEIVSSFCYHLGVGFQILNDLKDWQGDYQNKVVVGQDAVALRPTLLLALAIERADKTQRHLLEEILSGTPASAEKRLALLKQIFEQTGVFAEVDALIEQARRQATRLANEVEPGTLNRFLHFLVETVLAAEELPEPCVESSSGR